MKALLPLFLALFLAGCASVEAIQTATPDLVLATAQVRKVQSITVTFPAGRYVAAFRKDGRTYYQAQSTVTSDGTALAASGVAVDAAGKQFFFAGGTGAFPIAEPLALAAP